MSADGGPMKVTVVLPAAGTGLRAGTPTPKQFWPVDSNPLLFYTLSTLESAECIHRVVCPTAADHVERLQDKAASQWGFTKVTFVSGGATRHRSIAGGLASVADDTDVVIVHDAVRPFVDETTLAAVATAAAEHGAAGTILPLVSTVIRVDADGFLEESLDRSLYRGSQTPQAFRTAVIKTAYSAASSHELDHGTECLALALKYGRCRVKLIDGQADRLWKVTYQHDLFAAEQLLKKEMRQVALVTGGTRGIGYETVVSLANRGFKVAVLARTRDDVTRVAQEVGGLALVADVSDAEQVRAAYASVIETYGRVDVVVNNAGQGIPSSIETMTDAQWRQTVDCNLSGTFYCCREAMRALRRGGRGGVIVNVGSSAARGTGRVEQGAYASTKAGIHNLTETLAMEGQRDRILAYCVAPIRTATDLRAALAPHDASEVGEGGDMDMCLRPSDVAAAIVSVVMDANPHLSGQSFWLRHP
eukprot:m.105358 g.105358  ORF g.105358 m.105358 type:complete len:475 (-) comp10549_c1_seq3:6455-7879(-)